MALGLGWASNCDQFWSDQNGGCSDEFGQFIQPAGGGSATVSVIGGSNPVLPSIVTRTATPMVGGSSAMTNQRILAGVSNSTLLILATGVLAVMIFSKR